MEVVGWPPEKHLLVAGDGSSCQVASYANIFLRPTVIGTLVILVESLLIDSFHCAVFYGNFIDFKDSLDDSRIMAF